MVELIIVVDVMAYVCSNSQPIDEPHQHFSSQSLEGEVMQGKEGVGWHPTRLRFFPAS